MPGRKPNPFASLRSHRFFALLIGSVILMAGIPLALIFGRHEYSAEAMIEISPTFPSAVLAHSPAFSSDQQYREFVQQQVAEIGSYETATMALEELGNDRWLWQRSGESERMAAERLMKAIDVNPIADTYLISVSFAGDRPDGPAQIVNGVVNAFLRRQRRQELEQSDQRVQLLARHRAELEKESDSLRAHENQLAQVLGVSTFGAGFVSPYDKMLDNANSALDTARRASIEARAHLDALNADQERTKSLEVDSTAEQIVAADPQANDARTQLTKQREALFLELQELGPKHPGRRVLEEQMQRIDEELGRLTSDRIDKAEAMLRKNHQAKAQREISAAQAQVDQANLAEKGIEQQVSELRDRAAAFGAKYKEAVAVDSKLASDAAQIQQIEEQIGVLQAETQSPGFVSLESAARTPDIPSRGKRRKILVIFFLGALVLAVGLPTLLDMVDPLIKTADELEAIVGFPPFGAALGDEHRAAREALRRIALGVVRECRVSGTRSFVLTPVSEGTASRRLAFALAEQIQEFGINALAVDGRDVTDKLNRKGSQTNQVKVEGTMDSATIALPTPLSVNDQRAPVRMAASKATRSLAGLGPNGHTAQAGENGLMATLSGTVARDPYLRLSRKLGRETLEFRNSADSALATQAFESLLIPAPVRSFSDNLCDAHDIVLFDSPSILTSADAEMLIQMPAGAILVVRSGHDVPRDVAAAVRRLERISPPVVGTVITFEPKVETNNDCSPQAIVRRVLAAR
jgi:capsular polysaccharide biosynthesis protein